jgi:GDP-L-fucose synthase
VPKNIILICGATGFIGRNLVEYFGKRESFFIRAVYNERKPFNTSHLAAKVEWIKADLRSPTDVENVMNDVSIVIQAAATTSGAKDIISQPYIHVTDNAVMNSLLLRSAYHNRVDHFVFFSCTVMYPSSEKALTEHDFNPSEEVHPRYFGVGHTKLYIEKMLKFFSEISEMKTTAIRHSNIYGPYDKYDFERSHVFGATISKIMLADDEIVVWGDGREERDLLHVADLCRFVDATIEKQTENHRVYNCGCGTKVSINQLVQKIIQKSGKNLEIEYDVSKPSINTKLFLDCSLAQEELDWAPSIEIDEGIENTITWWKENIDRRTLKTRD